MRRLLIVPLILGFSLSLCAQQPGNMTQVGGVNVSLYSTLFNATSATATQTSSAIRLPGFSGHGILSVIFQTLTGSPATCQIALEMQQNTGTTPASAAFFTQAITPSASYQSFTVVPSANFDAGDTVVAVWSCGTYPTISTTMTVTFNPTPFVVSAEVDGQKNTYRASAVGFTAAAGIIADLTGSATKTIRVTEVDVACSTSGTAAFTDLTILKNSAADTVGTSATMTVTPHDSNDPAGSATAKNYTAAPTAGTLAGTLYSYRFLNQGSTTVQPTLWSWRPGTNPGERAVVLRGTAQQLAVKLAAVVATETCDVAFEWTEE